MLKTNESDRRECPLQIASDLKSGQATAHLAQAASVAHVF